MDLGSHRDGLIALLSTWYSLSDSGINFSSLSWVFLKRVYRFQFPSFLLAFQQRTDYFTSSWYIKILKILKTIPYVKAAEEWSYHEAHSVFLEWSKIRQDMMYTFDPSIKSGTKKKLNHACRWDAFKCGEQKTFLELFERWYITVYNDIYKCWKLDAMSMISYTFWTRH